MRRSPFFRRPFRQPSVHEKVTAGNIAFVFRIVHVFDIRESRSDNSNLYLIVDVTVYASAEYDICRIVDNALYESCRRLHLVHRQVIAADDIQDNTFCAFDRCGKQGAVYGEANRFYDPVFTFCNADTHMGQPLVFKNCANIGKIEIDKGGIDDQVGNAANTLL